MEIMKHEIGGIEIRPENADNIGIRLDFTGDADDAVLNVDSITLSNEAYKLINASRAQWGLFQGIPYTVKLGTLTLEYFVNLTENAQFTDSTVTCSIVKRRSTGWFMQQANSTSWEVLNSITPITGGFDIPYVIVKDNQVELLITLALTGYSLTKELIEAIELINQRGINEENWERDEISQEDEFYCSVLCGQRKNCKYYKAHLEKLDKKEKEEADIIAELDEILPF